MNISQIENALKLAGCNFVTGTISGEIAVWVNSTPNGGRGSYGCLMAGDDGSTGTCQRIVRRKGEIAAILRANR